MFLAAGSQVSHEVIVKMTARAVVTGGLTGTRGSDFMVGKLVLAWQTLFLAT